MKSLEVDVKKVFEAQREIQSLLEPYQKIKADIYTKFGMPKMLIMPGEGLKFVPDFPPEAQAIIDSINRLSDMTVKRVLEKYGIEN